VKNDPAAPVIMARGMIALQYSGVTEVVGREEPSQIGLADWTLKMADAYMQWEYKLVALGLLVDSTEPHQREKHEQILNDLGREGWEAVAYVAQSDTGLLKRPINVNSLDRP
jgi:hypothetical protein